MEKEQMHPLRYKTNYVLVPLYLFLGLALVVGVIVLDATVLGNEDAPGLLTYLGLAFFVCASVALIAFSSFVSKKELQAEKARYSYLFTPVAGLEKESVTVNVEEGISYTLTKEGIKAEWDEGEEQVFDDVRNNVRFVDWEDAELSLATHNHFRRIHIALAVLFDSSYGEKEFPVPDVFIIPLTEEVFSALEKFELKEKLSADWVYLLYNPEDAFKQILARGRILKMRNKKTGKVFVNEKGELLG